MLNQNILHYKRILNNDKKSIKKVFFLKYYGIIWLHIKKEVKRTCLVERQKQLKKLEKM